MCHTTPAIGQESEQQGSSAIRGSESPTEQHCDACSLLLPKTAEALRRNLRTMIHISYDPQEEAFVVSVYDNLRRPMACKALWDDDYDQLIADLIKDQKPRMAGIGVE